MKNSLLVLILAMPVYCSAQFEKHILFASGSGSFSSQERTTYANNISGSYHASSLTISPKIGIFVIDHLLVGPNISLAWSANTYANPTYTGDSKSFGWSAGPFVRYYVFQGLYMYGEYTWGAAKSSTESVFSGSTDTQKNTSKVFGAGAGYSLLLNADKSLALDFSVGYRKRNQNIPPINSISTTKYEESGLIVSVGLSGLLHLLSSK